MRTETWRSNDPKNFDKKLQENLDGITRLGLLPACRAVPNSPEGSVLQKSQMPTDSEILSIMSCIWTIPECSSQAGVAEEVTAGGGHHLKQQFQKQKQIQVTI